MTRSVAGYLSAPACQRCHLSFPPSQLLLWPQTAKTDLYALHVNPRHYFWVVDPMKTVQRNSALDRQQRRSPNLRGRIYISITINGWGRLVGLRSPMHQMMSEGYKRLCPLQPYYTQPPATRTISTPLWPRCPMFFEYLSFNHWKRLTTVLKK
ncbi:hypothetical protein BDD12DRAFT_158528 [Trichophaea hybrida]|nr:hypothetical protein BDD12DRAFT_158528 [Trichophaea hybrida]